MWPHRVVDPLPLSQLAVEFLHLQRAGRDLIKLLGVSPLGALDRAVELGRSRWQNEQAQAALLAGLLEVGSELGTAIHLQSTDGKGHAVQQGFQELGSEYLICLKRGLSSEQMVVELGMTVDEVIEFGDEFFTRVFERIRRSIN